MYLLLLLGEIGDLAASAAAAAVSRQLAGDRLFFLKLFYRVSVCHTHVGFSVMNWKESLDFFSGNRGCLDRWCVLYFSLLLCLICQREVAK